MTLSNNILDQYLVNGNNAIYFKMIRKMEDVDNEDLVFHPEMSHQHFGENETIFGYRGLRINLYYGAGSLETYFNVSYASMIDTGLSNGVPADNVEHIITEKMPKDFTQSIDYFSKTFEDGEVESKFKPFGNLKHTYSKDAKDGGIRHFEIYTLGHDTETDALSPAFQKYHDRLQTFLLFFVDAASYIDAGDPGWTFYLLYERYKVGGGSSDEPWRYAIVGYSTVYHFYAYPEHKRPRLSQILILPPFQRAGHGQELLKIFYRDSIANPKVRDITVEDPSDNFQRMRDFIDCGNVRRLPEFAPVNLMKGFSKEMAERGREKLRLNVRQTRRVYEILRLLETKEDEHELREFRLCVKKRLNASIMRTSARCHSQGQSSGDANPFSQEVRWQNLQTEFEAIMEEYEPVVEKLKNI